MPKAWVYQDDKQVKKRGAATASWYTGWLDPGGKRRCKSFGPGSDGKKLAFRHLKKVEAELLTGTYADVSKKTWVEFRDEYSRSVLSLMPAGSFRLAVEALDHFERLVKPAKMVGLTASALAKFVAARSKETGRKGKPLSPATVNRDLRTIRSALRKAAKWGYLPVAPDFEGVFLREPEKLPTYVEPDDFAKLYGACIAATKPAKRGCEPADWWRALSAFAYMTGWRIGAILALRREDLDLGRSVALSRAADNKGKRDQEIPLHAFVVGHLAALPARGQLVFGWPHDMAQLYEQLRQIQDSAEVKPRRKAYYTFHDFRRAFATMNAANLTPDALQRLMQHRDYQTTRRYIDLARQLRPEALNLYVPPTTPAKVKQNVN